MTPDKKKKTLHDIFVVIMCIAALVIIVRLWPILLLLLIGLIAYALWALFHVARQPVKSEPTPLPAPPEPISEQSVLTAAFGLLQRRITEQVAARYPNARWVWCVSDAFGQFSAGQPLTILLNGAGGYRRAVVQVNALQFAGLAYCVIPDTAQSDSGHPEQDAPPPEPEGMDYGLLSFEWVEANLQRLNVLSNEAIAAGQDEFCVPAEELPHGDSWPALCTELVRNGFAAAQPLADRIRIKIKTE